MADTQLKTVEWLSSLLDIPTAQVYDAIRKKDIPEECVLRIGRRIRIVESKVLQWANLAPANQA